MFGAKQAEGPDAASVLERAFAEGCTRIAVVSLHRGAGARTFLECTAAEFHARGVSVGVTRAPRIPLDAGTTPDAIPPVKLPPGSIVVTTSPVDEERQELEPLGPPVGRTAFGELGVFRVTSECEVPIYGPDDPETMATVLHRLGQESEGLALVDGAWERRDFAAPTVTRGVVLAVGAGYSGTPERSAAAVRYTVEMLGLPVVPSTLLGAWSAVVATGNVIVLHPDGKQTRVRLAPGENLVSRVQELDREVTAILFPGRLDDHVLGPLGRSAIRCTLVVRDATCFRAAPIYYRAWTKLRGEVRVVEPMRVVAVATNPSNHAGPDAVPRRFRELVSEAVPELPVHDVVLESGRSKRAGLWKLASLIGSSG